MRAILHIGTEKTGSTSLQAALAASRLALAAAGFRYARAPGDRAHLGLPLFAGMEIALADLMAIEGLADAAALARYRTRLRRELTVEVRRSPDACFIFSSEHCHSRLVDQADVARLRDLLAPLFDTIDVVVYLRRQDRVASSYYSTYLRGGGTSAAIIPPPIAADYFDYAALLARWSAVFGDRVTVVPYDSLRDDIARDFARRMGLPRLSDDFSGDRALNPAISAIGQEALRQFNVAFPDLEGPIVARLHEALIVADGAQHRGRPGRRPARARAQAFVATFAASNASVAQRHLDGGRLFDESFGDYPEHDEPVDPVKVNAIFARVLFRTERRRYDLAQERVDLHRSIAIAARGNEQLKDALDAAAAVNRNLEQEHRDLYRSIAIAAKGNEELRDACDRAVAGNRDLDGLLAAERVERRRLQVELGYYAGLVHLDAGKPEAARDLVSSALDLDPQHVALWHLLARIHHAADRGDDALRAIDRAIRLDPDDAVHREMRARFVAARQQTTAPANVPVAPVTPARSFWRRTSTR